MSIYTSTQSALDGVLRGVSGLPELQLENTRIDRKGRATTPFVRSTLLPREPIQLTIGEGGKNIYGGLYQVDVFYPIDAGKAALNTTVDAIVSAFYRQQLSGGVTIHLAWSEVGRRDEPFYTVPVFVRWSVVSS